MSASQNVVAILRSQESCNALKEASGTINGHRVSSQVGNLRDLLPGVAPTQAPDALLLEIDPHDPQDLRQLSEILTDRFPSIPVVVTAASVSLQDVRNLMHLGVADFLPQPFNQEDLRTAIDRTVSMRRSHGEGESASGGKVISLLKGGGGVGATTLAVHAACVLATDKSFPARVALFDLDVQFGTAALYLDLDTRVGLTDLIESPERMDAGLLHGVMTRHACGIELLSAPREMVPLDIVSPDFITSTLKIARQEFDYILIDLPEAWTSWTYTTLQNSDLVMVISQLTVAGVRQARRQMDTLASQGLSDTPVKIVLNRTERGFMKSRQLKEAEKAFGRDVDYFVPSDFKVVNEALNEGVLLSEVQRRTKIEKAIEFMVRDAVSAWGAPHLEARATT